MLSGLGDKLTSIRRNEKGELLLQPPKTQHKRILNYHNLVGRYLSKEITIWQLIHEIFVNNRDLDTIKEDDILRTVEWQFEVSDPRQKCDAIMSVNKEPAFISLPVV